MLSRPRQLPTSRIVTVGLVGLAAGMGIGRFALTPLMPLMQAQGIGLAQGGWLAAANYAGYLVGALTLASLALPPARAARLGLFWVALLTMAMVFDTAGALALALRFSAGIASAFVLVGISGWTLTALAHQQRTNLAGVVFAGVGTGIAIAGFVGLLASARSSSASAAWLGLGGLALVACFATWRPLTKSIKSAGTSHQVPRQNASANYGKLIACYGVFGLGYIIPATFLPAQACQLVNDPWVFGWVWPLFGTAAAVSTVATSLLFARTRPERVWACAHVILAVGVALPAVWPTLSALVLSALCVGGTFMVITMAGMQSAREAAENAPRLMSLMTAAFAAGQLLGPLLVSLASASAQAIQICSLIASALLLGSAASLAMARPVLSASR